MAIKKITIDNDVSYTDAIYITPLSASELANAMIVTPDPTEEITVETCDCDATTPPGGNTGGSTGGGTVYVSIDLFVDTRPQYPDLFKVHPVNYTIRLPRWQLKPLSSLG